MHVASDPTPTTIHPPAGPAPTQLLSGTACALGAGLLWGIVFVAPLWLPQYPAALLSCGRYLAFGLVALPLAWADRRQLAQLQRGDWIEALKLSLVGNLLYYGFLSAAIQRAGAPLPTMLIGTLPVVIAIVSNRRDASRDGRLPWRGLLPSLLLIALGIALVNHAEWQALGSGRTGGDAWRLGQGALLAIVAVACWTWYPIRNADWMRAHADRNPRIWATAQGLATLPLALVGFALFAAWQAVTGSGFPLPVGPEPARFVGIMAMVGLLCSWLGTLLWNEASRRVPTALAGQLIVFETLSALLYAFVLRGRVPPVATLAGIAALVAGVLWALRVRPVRGEAPPATPH